MQLWKFVLVGAFVVIGFCSEGRAKPTEDAINEEYAMDEEDYDDDFDDENSSSAKDTNQVDQPLPTMDKTWSVYSADVGEQATLLCPVRNKGQHVIMWYKNQEVLTQEKMTLKTGFKVNADFSLVIPNVTTDFAGEYTCKLVPSGLVSSCKLNVRQAPGVKITDGLRDLMDRTMTYREGEKIRLICEVKGYPLPTFHWDTKHHRLHDMPGVIVNKGELIIESAESHHSGIYECHAENEQKEATQESVHIVIEYIPKVIANRPEVNAAEGSQAVLHCNYHSNPDGRAQWLRNGKVLENGDKYSFQLDEKNHHKRLNLKVANIEMDDLGAYTCEVTNKLGKSDVNVTIMYEPEMAVFVGNELLVDDFTSLTWRVTSAQPLVEVDLYYKKSGDKQWRHVRPFDIHESSESGVYNIIHKVKLGRGVWYTKLRTKNAFGASKMSAEHEISVVSAVHQAAILNFDTSASDSISRTSALASCLPLILVPFFARL